METKKEGRATMVNRICRIGITFGTAILAIDVPSAWACPVCFGAADSAMTQGMNMAILLMLGVLGVVATGFLMFFVRLFKLSRMNVGRDVGVPRSARLEGSY